MLGILAGLGLIAPSTSCSVHEHRVGLGPTGQGEESKRAFYLFFGLFRLNEVDSQRMASGATSYAVRTERSFLDYVLAPLMLPFTITSRTVTVSK